MSPDEQMSINFVSLGSVRTFILAENFHSSLKRVSVLKQRTGAKCLMKHTQGRGLRETGEDWLGIGGEKRRVGFSQTP